MQVCNANGQSRHHVNTMEMLGHGNAGTTLMNTSNGQWQRSCRMPSYTTVMSLTFLLQSHSVFSHCNCKTISMKKIIYQTNTFIVFAKSWLFLVPKIWTGYFRLQTPHDGASKVRHFISIHVKSDCQKHPMLQVHTCIVILYIWLHTTLRYSRCSTINGRD